MEDILGAVDFSLDGELVPDRTRSDDAKHSAPFFWAMVAAVGVSAVLLLFEAQTAHLAGYVIGLWFVGSLAVAHRLSVARSRESGRVVRQPRWMKSTVILLLIAGFLLGALHLIPLFSWERVI